MVDKGQIETDNYIDHIIIHSINSSVWNKIKQIKATSLLYLYIYYKTNKTSYFNCTFADHRLEPLYFSRIQRKQVHFLKQMRFKECTWPTMRKHQFNNVSTRNQFNNDVRALKPVHTHHLNNTIADTENRHQSIYHSC